MSGNFLGIQGIVPHLAWQKCCPRALGQYSNTLACMFTFDGQPTFCQGKVRINLLLCYNVAEKGGWKACKTIPG